MKKKQAKARGVEAQAPVKKDKPKKVKSTKKEKEGKEQKISFLELWRRYILNSLKKDLSSYPPYRNYNFYSNGMATMSGKDLITFYYTIDGYPAQLPIDFRDRIRQEARDGVRISFVSTFEPTRIDWASPQMKSKIKTWKTIEQDSGDIDEYNYRENIGLADSMQRRKLSLIYLSDAEVRRKRNLFKYRTMMIIVGSRGANFDKTILEVNKICENSGIQITRIDTKLFDFLRAFSPFSMELSGDILKECGNNTIPDEQLARFSTYDQGKIGRGGTSWGTDIYSGFPVYKLFKRRDTDAENILITAETGGGKSFFVKYLLIQLLGQPNIKATINDIEGFEYIPLAGFIANKEPVIVLNMAEGKGSYFDPFEIAMTGKKDLDEDMFSLCNSSTLSVFRVLVGNELAINNDWGKKIISNAITKAYTDLGVDADDMSTWSRSEGHDLFFVYSKFRDLYQECLYYREHPEEVNSIERYKLNDGYLDVMDKIVAKLSEYFEPYNRGGIHSNVFSNRIALRDIVNAKLVICSFGLAGKSPDSIDPTQLALSQISAANIAHLRSIFSKAEGKYQIKLWEEFQRWGSVKGSEGIIKTAVTGGRKLGDINFIITNNVKELLDSDRFAIFDNVTSFAIGAIATDETRSRLVKQLSVPLLKHDLDCLVTKKGDTESSESEVEVSSMYDKAFLVHLDRSITTIAKVQLPKHIAESAIFRTGVDING